MPRLKFHLVVCLLFLYFFGALANAQPASSSPTPKKTSYLFSYFTGNGEDGLHLAWSADGLKWSSLGGAKSYLAPAVGESKLMRDPCLLLGPDGVFRLVWTTSWGGQTIGYASSTDLIHWTAQKAIPVMAGEPACKNCWAPEVFYDKAKQDYLIIWSTTIPGRYENTHRMYSTTTKDFETFTPAKLFFEPGYNVIDGTIAECGGKFYLVHKDERQTPVKKNLRLATSDMIEGPYSPPTAPFTKDWVEGPTVLKIGDEYTVYFDCYRDKHYGAMKTRDFQKWEDVTAQLVMPAGVRHGTALEVPEALIKALQEDKTPSAAPAPKAKARKKAKK